MGSVSDNIRTRRVQQMRLEDVRRIGRNILEWPSTAARFSGTAYVAGVKISGLNADATKPWVKCDLAAATATEEAGPPSDPFPSNEEWFYKNETYGDIHVPRA